MRVQTLIYIKEMLEKEVETRETLEKEIKTREKACKKVGERLAEAEDESGVQWNTSDSEVDRNIQALRKMKETQRKLLNEAKDALEDFLQQDWK